jgi:TonB-dependent receptor
MHRALRPALGAFLLIAAGTTPVLAQEATAVAADAKPGEEKTLQLDKLVVKGYRESLASSLEAERAAKTIKSVITADALGNLPDKNVADALSRLSGISTTISDGDGRFVTIRGMEPGLNGITLNGETVATSDSDGRSGRSAPLDVLSTATAGSIEVHKTVTPDMDGQSIGGTINIITPSAFDYTKPVRFFGTAEGGLNDMNAQADIYSVSLNYAQRFAQNKWGIFGSLLKSHAPYVAQEVELRRYSNYGPNGDWLPDEIRVSHKEGYRDREGATINLEYRPSDDRRFYLRGYTTQYDNYMDRPQYTGRIRHTTPTSATSGFATVRTAAYEGRIERTERTTNQLVGGFELPLTSNLELSASANYSEAEENNPLLTYIQLAVNATNLAAINASGPARYDITDADHPQIIFPSALYLPQSWTVSGARPEESYVFEKTKTGRADLVWKGDVAGKPTTIKGGLKALDRRKAVNDVARTYSPLGAAATATFASDFGTGGTLGTPGPIFQDGRYIFGTRHNTGAYLSWLNATLPTWPGQVDHENANWRYLTAASVGNSIEDAYSLTEKISAAYLMASVDVTSAFTVFGGVRVEHTDESLTSNLFVSGASEGVENIHMENDYNTVLPNLQFHYDINEKLVLRGAVTYTLGRPDFVDMAPISSLFYQDIDNNGRYEGSLEIGNPDLKPYESTNYDVYLTYYLPKDSAVSLGYFAKRISNPIYSWVKEETDVEFQGRQFETLVRESVFNAEPGDVQGIELSYQQNFTFLPAPFDGFGVVFNYAWIDSSVSTFDRADEVTFFRQPKYVGNAQLYYQNKRFEARLAYHWQGANLEGVGDTPKQDSYGDKRGTLDFKGSVRLDDHWSVYAEARNLTNDGDRNYLGDPRYQTLNNQFGITYLAGVSWNY